MRDYLSSTGREDLDQTGQRFMHHGNGHVKGQSPKQKRKTPSRGALDFTSLASEGNHFVNEVANELGCSRNRAARITRSVLHALRDRLPPNESVEFAQGLPLVLKGVWLDQYDLSDSPVTCRTADEFIDLVEEKGHLTARDDFPTRRHTSYSIRGVFRVLEDTVDMGQMDKVRLLLGEEILTLIDGQGRI